MVKTIIFCITLFFTTSIFAQFANISFFKNHSPYLSFTTSAQSIHTSNCSGIVTLQTKNGAGVATNVASNLTVDLSGPASVTFYSNSTCTTSVSSIVVTSGTNSVSLYFISTSTGSSTITAAATGYKSSSQVETITTNPFVWTGGGINANWSTALNWSGGVAPSSVFHYTVFDNSCVTNCSPSINANMTAGGVRINSGFTGTITQVGANTMSLGSRGWIQMDGAFVGSSSGASINISGAFFLFAGSFQSTTGTLQYSSNLFTITNTAVFLSNSGLVIFNGNCSSPTINTGSIDLNNVTFIHSGCSNNPFTIVGTMKVLGNLILNGLNSINSGTIDVSGNITGILFNGGGGTIRLVGTGTQNFSGGTSGYFPKLVIISSGIVNLSGTIMVNYFYGSGSFTYTSGTLNAGTSTLSFVGGCGTTSINPGSAIYNDVRIGVTTCSNQNFALTGTMNISGNLLLSNNGGSGGGVIGGVLQVSSNVTVESFGGGNASLNFVGAGTQVVSQATGSFPSGTMTVSNPSGITLASNVTWNGTSQLTTVTTGNINMAGYNLTLRNLNLNGNSITKNAGVLNVNSTIAATGSLYGGTVDP